MDQAKKTLSALETFSTCEHRFRSILAHVVGRNQSVDKTGHGNLVIAQDCRADSNKPD